jgi:hypothetical protein
VRADDKLSAFVELERAVCEFAVDAISYASPLLELARAVLEKAAMNPRALELWRKLMRYTGRSLLAKLQLFY